MTTVGAERRVGERVPVGLMRCPSCERPPLLEYLRTHTPMAVPARYCPRCNGIWAEPPVLSGGVNPHPSEHPAFAPGPRGHHCARCEEPLGAGDRCTTCARERPAIACPACATEMERSVVNRMTVDDCPACGCLWFDTGELRSVLGEVGYEPRRLAAAMAAQQAAEDKPEGILDLNEDKDVGLAGLIVDLAVRLLAARFGIGF